MNQQEILKYNKRCTEFLNLHRDNEVAVYNMSSYPFKYLKFDIDWNWIMDVIEAIGEIADWSLECLNGEKRQFQMCIPLSGTYITLDDKKEAVVEAINQFLIWYEQNKQL